MNIKKKPQNLNYGITRSEASYQVFMLDAINKLVDQTKKNNALLSQLVYGDDRNNIFTPQVNRRINQSHSKKYITGVNFRSTNTPLDKNHDIKSQKRAQDRAIQQVNQSKFQSQLKESSEKSQQKLSPQSHQNQINKEFKRFRQVMEQASRNNRLLLQKILQSANLNRPDYSSYKQDPQQAAIAAITALMQKKKMKKYGNYGILQEIMPFSDKRQIKARFKILDLFDSKEQLSNKFDKADFKLKMIQWVGMVFRATASICWNLMLANQLSFQQTKILFTQNIIYNYIECMNDIEKYLTNQDKLQLANFINLTSIDVLQFLCKQYPQTKVEQPNIALRKAIPMVQNHGQARFNLISMASQYSENIQNQNLKIQFCFREDKDYSVPIMKTINYMIDRTDEQFQQFQNIMTNIFSRMFIPQEKRKNIKIQQSQNHINFQYKQQVKAHSYYLIGRKIPKNTPKYTEDEILSGMFFVKSPAILRIITKWLEQLWQFVSSPLQKLIHSTNQLKDYSGKALNMSSQIKKLLFTSISNNFNLIEQKVQKLNVQFMNIQYLLTHQRYTKDQHQNHLSQDQLIVGKYCSSLKNAISSYVSSQLGKIIYYLLKIPQQINIRNLQFRDDDYKIQALKYLNNVNLVSLNIFDLLRCKCHSTEEEIISIVQTLKAFQKQNPKFQIIRVKDRLNQGTRDILINAQYNGGMIWQIQLGVSSHLDVKQNLLDKYNHFLYELKRSKMGPLSQCVSIWTSLEQRSMYFEQLNQRKKIINQKVEIKHYGNNKSCDFNKFYEFRRPLICNGCKQYFSIPLTSLLNVRCQQCRVNYCGLCFFQSLNEMQKKNFMFRNFNNKKLMSDKALQQLLPYTDYSKPFPKEGFFIKKNFLNKEICYYKAIISDKCQDSENEYQIFMARIKISQGQVSIRTLHRNSFIIKLINGQFFFKNPQQMKKTQLKNLWIYYFDKKPEQITLEMLQEQIKNENLSKQKYLVCLYEPNFAANLKILAKVYEKNRFLINLKNVMDITKYSISVYRFPSFSILNTLLIQQKELQALIVHRNNQHLLKQFLKKKTTIVNMQNKDITTEMQYLLNQNNDENIIYCSKIQKMYLANNQIKNIECFKILTNLSALSIPNNQIKSLKGIQTLWNLTYLKVDENQITSLVQLQNLKKLNYLSAGINKIISLKGIQTLKQLTYISVRQNNIESIKELEKMQKLNKLFLQKNPIKDITAIFRHKIKVIAMGDTLINPTQLISLQQPLKLMQLCLNSLNLTSIPKIFDNFTNLTELNLSHNKINKIQNISKLQELLFLDLNHNQIQQIENLQNCVYLQVLLLSSNNIRVVKNVKYFIECLEELDLENNPLQCINEFLIYQEKTGSKMRLKYTQSLISKLVKQQIQSHSYQVGNRSQND